MKRRHGIATEDHTWVSDTHYEELVQDVTDDLNGMVTPLIADRISSEDATTCQSSGTSNLCVILFEIGKGAGTNKFIEYMS